MAMRCDGVQAQNAPTLVQHILQSASQLTTMSVVDAVTEQVDNEAVVCFETRKMATPLPCAFKKDTVRFPSLGVTLD